MKSILVIISIMAAVLPAPMCAEFAISVPKQCRLSEEITRSVLRGSGTTEHQLEVSKQHLDYAVNPVAMRRFLSQEQALLRRHDLPVKFLPADQNFTAGETYKSRIVGASNDGTLRVTILMFAAKNEFVTVRVHTHNGSTTDHDLVVAQIKIEAITKEAQQDAPSNGG